MKRHVLLTLLAFALAGVSISWAKKTNCTTLWCKKPNTPACIKKCQTTQDAKEAQCSLRARQMERHNKRTMKLRNEACLRQQKQQLKQCAPYYNVCIKKEHKKCASACRLTSTCIACMKTKHASCTQKGQCNTKNRCDLCKQGSCTPGPCSVPAACNACRNKAKTTCLRQRNACKQKASKKLSACYQQAAKYSKAASKQIARDKLSCISKSKKKEKACFGSCHGRYERCKVNGKWKNSPCR